MKELLFLGENGCDYKKLKQLLTEFRNFNNSIYTSFILDNRKDYVDKDLWDKNTLNSIYKFSELCDSIVCLYKKVNVSKEKQLEVINYYNDFLKKLINILIEKSDGHFGKNKQTEFEKKYLLKG